MTCILIFQSVHQVMKAEKVLKERGTTVDLIPVPREISSDCGVAIQVPSEVSEEVLCFIGERGLSCVGCYQRGNGGRFERRR
jgi:hypothetical protein